MMPLTLGPTQPEDVTTVATKVATSEARSGMSYQRRVISGILHMAVALQSAARRSQR